MSRRQWYKAVVQPLTSMVQRYQDDTRLNTTSPSDTRKLTRLWVLSFLLLGPLGVLGILLFSRKRHNYLSLRSLIAVGASVLLIEVGVGLAVTKQNYQSALWDIAEKQFPEEVTKLQPGEPLPPAIKRQVELSPEGQALTKSAGMLTPEKEADFADYNTQLKRDAEWTNNQMTSKDWRAANKIAVARRAAQRELKELRNEISKKKNPNDLDKAMERYYKLIDDNYDKVAERFKPDMDEELDFFMDSLQGKLRQDVIDNLHPRATPLQKQYYADMEVLKPYFDVVDKSPLRQDKDIVQAIKIIERLKNQITQSQVKGDQREVIVATREALRIEAQFRIKQHLARLKQEKDRIRLYNPEIDRLLVKWGYASKPLRPLLPAPTRELEGVK